MIRLYEKGIAKFKSIEKWLKYINCNIGVKQGCPLSPTLSGIYIDKLESCLEEASCSRMTLARIAILLLYVDDIVLLVRCPSDLDKQLKILKDLHSNMGNLVDTDQTKVMIIKSKKDTYANFEYDNNNLEEVCSYKYLISDIHHQLSCYYIIEKRIYGGWKAYFGLENNCKSAKLVAWDKNNFLFETLVTTIIFYSFDVWGCNTSRESWRKIEQIQKHFIMYNLKIKSNAPYHILLIDVSLPLIKNIAMTRYLIYKNMIDNMED